MIRRLLPEDAPRLAQIEALQPYSAHWGEKGFVDELPNPYSFVWCWEEKGQVHGFIALRLAAGFCEILNMAVHPDECRRGIGFKLLYFALSQVRAHGGERVTLEVNARNEAAIGLYTKMGFRPCGRRHKFYNGTDDALIMGANL